MLEMAELLRKGARMLGIVCPKCGTPIFQLSSGETICPTCKKEFRNLEDENKGKRVEGDNELERVLNSKLEDMRKLLIEEKNPKKIREIALAISSIFDIQKHMKEDKLDF